LSLILIHFDKTAALVSQDSPLVAAWQGLSTHPSPAATCCVNLDVSCKDCDSLVICLLSIYGYVAWVQIYKY